MLSELSSSPWEGRKPEVGDWATLIVIVCFDVWCSMCLCISRRTSECVCSKLGMYRSVTNDFLQGEGC